ncbi:transmembrane protein 8B [Diachasmimorpha longicaudata]|uniref:transmembrane protein 8B n=1 Tax=Diachasmimorpha longicaudata TaxID=58733 RepID=UPI0030B8947C
MPRNSVVTLTIWWAMHVLVSGKLERIALESHTVLDDFSGYHTISIVHFHVPPNVINSLFKFTAKELKTGGIGRCPPRDVTVYLKYGSIALASPDGSKIGAKLFERRRTFSNFTFKSELDEYELQRPNPAPGDWYAIAFRSWSDPDSEKITQQGLGVTCSTILDSSLSVEKAAISLMIDPNNNYTVFLNQTNNSARLQFLISESNKPVNISISSTCADLCTVLANLIVEDVVTSVVINFTHKSLSFIPYPGYFHYLNLRLLSGNFTNVTVSFVQPPQEQTKHNEIDLVRKTLPEFFTFDYEFFSENSTTATPVNISSSGLTVLSFKIGSVYDIGGTLSIGIKLLNESRDIVVVGCISLGTYPIITENGSCSISTSTVPGDLWINSTTPQFLHIPFPEPGTWHLTLKSFRIPSNCTCIPCTPSSCSCNCMHPTPTAIESSIGSSPCIEGKCSSNGKCTTYLHSGGFAFSACHCYGGYRGFDCADDTYVLTGGRILVRFLMLTLSNLAFIASVYIAFKREYYTEAIVYGAVMFFSTFYHACESGEDVMGVCITKLSILQFCDFYNALLSIWVTLVAMASFGAKVTSFCQISGAIVLAFAAELDRTALWVFLLPAVTGFGLIGFSWGSRCRRQRNLGYPASRYKNIYLPAGLGIVSLGLICYAFLQTRRNYHIVHSFWHICVALGVVLLLPKRKHMK